MGLRRGFKSEADQIAREIRSELGLAPAACLDPWHLARHLEIPIVGLSEVADTAPNAAREFGIVDTAAFSAVTVFRPTNFLTGCYCIRRRRHSTT